MNPFHLGLGEWVLNPQRLARFPYHSGHPIPGVRSPLPSVLDTSLPPWPPLASGISAMIANLVGTTYAPVVQSEDHRQDHICHKSSDESHS